jgi:ribulose-bisphosphate carboxylase small chain
MRVTQGTFSFLPELTDEEIEAQIRYALGQGWAIMVEYTDDPHPRNSLWDMWKQPSFDLEPDEASQALQDVNDCRDAYPNHYIKLVAYDASLGRQTTGLSFLVNRPSEEPGFRVERTETHDRTINYTVVPYAHQNPVGRRYGNEGSLTTQRTSTGVQDGTPGPESPKFKLDESAGNGTPAPARDEGAGES